MTHSIHYTPGPDALHWQWGMGRAREARGEQGLNPSIKADAGRSMRPPLRFLALNGQVIADPGATC
jgi:hypothetical protein